MNVYLSCCLVDDPHEKQYLTFSIWMFQRRLQGGGGGSGGGSEKLLVYPQTKGHR